MALTAAGRRLLKRGAQLDLFEELIRRDPTADQGLIPWDGISPRDLTECRKRISLGHEGTSLTPEDAQIEEQYQRFLHGW